MNNMDTIVDICQIITALIAVAGFVLSVIIYKRTLNRERRLDTLKTLSELRVKFSKPGTTNTKYLKALEFFATGVNQGIYDINIVKKMSGNRLVKQYDENLRDLVEKKRQKKDGSIDSEAYVQYETMIEELRKKQK